jgi:hypothetical protein
MPACIETWTHPRDSQLRRMRLEGASWEAIADALAVSLEAASARAAQIGARRPPPGATPRDDPAREPLAAGHPRAWGVLTRGTWLAGTRYPTPASLGSGA